MTDFDNILRMFDEINDKYTKEQFGYIDYCQDLWLYHVNDHPSRGENYYCLSVNCGYQGATFGFDKMVN